MQTESYKHLQKPCKTLAPAPKEQKQYYSNSLILEETHCFDYNQQLNPFMIFFLLDKNE